jgi:hypothetical protein
MIWLALISGCAGRPAPAQPVEPVELTESEVPLPPPEPEPLASIEALQRSCAARRLSMTEVFDATEPSCQSELSRCCDGCETEHCAERASGCTDPACFQERDEAHMICLEMCGSGAGECTHLIRGTMPGVTGGPR